MKQKQIIYYDKDGNQIKASWDKSIENELKNDYNINLQEEIKQALKKEFGSNDIYSFNINNEK